MFGRFGDENWSKIVVWLEIKFNTFVLAAWLAQLEAEVVRMSHLTKFFDKDRKNKIGLLSSDKQRSLMECIFDDTVIEAPKKNEGLKKGKSGMLEAMFMNA